MNLVAKTHAEIPFTRYSHKHQQLKPSEMLEQIVPAHEKSVIEGILRPFG